MNPLSAAAAAAAAAGRVALGGQAGSSGVLLASNLNEEVSTHELGHAPQGSDAHSPLMDRSHSLPVC